MFYEPGQVFRALMLRMQVFWVAVLSSRCLIPKILKECTTFIFKGVWWFRVSCEHTLCVCVYVCMYVCMYVCVYMYIAICHVSLLLLFAGGYPGNRRYIPLKSWVSVTQLPSVTPQIMRILRSECCWLSNLIKLRGVLVICKYKSVLQAGKKTSF
jgi:hypothetical protein